MELWRVRRVRPASRCNRPAWLQAERPVAIWAATHPVAEGQSVSVRYVARSLGHGPVQDEVPAYWQFNRDGNSYWKAELPPQPVGTALCYWLMGDSPRDHAYRPTGGCHRAAALARAHLALPPTAVPGSPTIHSTRELSSTDQPELHTLRDYYSKTALLLDYPDVHVSINVTPVLLWQLDDYVQRGATDRALELSVTDVGELGREGRRELLSSFFEADWHRQIMPHPRYRGRHARRLA